MRDCSILRIQAGDPDQDRSIDPDHAIQQRSWAVVRSSRPISRQGAGMRQSRAWRRRTSGANGSVSRIRILLAGVPQMLNDIIRATIAAEPDMTIVEDAIRRNEDLGAYTRRHRIDVVIIAAGNEKFTDDKVVETLRSNPRLSLLSMDAQRDQGTLHYLVPVHEAVGRLAQSSLIAAIRAGAALRLG